MFARPAMNGVLDPAHGGGWEPQILSTPSFSIMITTRWSKYAPEGVDACTRGIAPDDRTVPNERRIIRLATIWVDLFLFLEKLSE